MSLADQRPASQLHLSRISPLGGATDCALRIPRREAHFGTAEPFFPPNYQVADNLSTALLIWCRDLNATVRCHAPIRVTSHLPGESVRVGKIARISSPCGLPG